MKLSLAPIPYAWSKDKIISFYEEMATSPVDIVYLGETVCLKRHEVRLEDWLEIAKKLKAAKKEVVLSTQVLIESDAHLRVMQQITQNADFLVEANDMGAVRRLSQGKHFVCGMHTNSYSCQNINLLASLGAIRFVMPFELSQEDVKAIISQKEKAFEVEVLAYGRLPLAFSARCFTARCENLPKDDCQFRCTQYPEGLCLKTQNDEPLFILNGIQIQSQATYCLLNDILNLQSMGVDILRIVPQLNDTKAVIDLFDCVLHQKETIDEAMSKIKTLTDKLCNGYWYQKAGMTYV